MISDNLPSGTRGFVSFPIGDFQKTKRQMLTWVSRVDIFCFLDSQGYPDGIAPGVGCVLAAGVRDSCEAEAGRAFAELREWAGERGEWIFGHFGYDLAAETEPGVGGPEAVGRGRAGSGPDGRGLKSDPIGFPDLFFFVPQVLIELRPGVMRIGCFDAEGEAIWREIGRIPVDGVSKVTEGGGIPRFEARFTAAEYRERVVQLQRHILRGDCYEINFCQEFYSQPAELDVLAAWWSLSQTSPNPFSCFYRIKRSYLLCASPERYLKKTGNQLVSQPIKGTSARHPGCPAADSASARELSDSAKDRSENVMIVDLVRNDLSKVCLPGSVRVEELYGIYPFPQVFQMISTVKGAFSPDLHWTEAIRETFPMGSMTGAPKHRVVALIDQYERSRRGIFSGSVGYVSPWGDFDFNVVIRSLLYNRDHGYLSYQVGSGITFYSDPEAEYAECRVKARGILAALGVPESSGAA
jgi:para-aminobenzoate synthetase component I